MLACCWRLEVPSPIEERLELLDWPPLVVVSRRAIHGDVHRLARLPRPADDWRGRTGGVERKQRPAEGLIAKHRVFRLHSPLEQPSETVGILDALDRGVARVLWDIRVVVVMHAANTAYEHRPAIAGEREEVVLETQGRMIGVALAAPAT
jgi:hypothetical protein